MAVNYSIKADVVDIRSDKPKQTDNFLVDTNVWYWLTYTKASLNAQSYQISNYPNYTNNALNAGATIFQSGLSLAELTHLIEKSERDIYNSSNSNVVPKVYRHNLHAERQKVCAEVQSACQQVLQLSSTLDITINTNLSQTAIGRFANDKVDGYDLFILESMSSHGVLQIITDDGDFTTVPGITVYTANKNVINAAKQQGRLVSR